MVILPGLVPGKIRAAGEFSCCGLSAALLALLTLRIEHLVSAAA
jgi:hypothetical protein